MGNIDLALDALGHAGRLSDGNSKPIAVRGSIFAKHGKTKEAQDGLSALEAVSREKYIPPYAMALVHSGLGQNEAGFDCLQRAYDVHDVHLSFLTCDPKWDRFRSDQRFVELVSRCSFAKSALLHS